MKLFLTLILSLSTLTLFGQKVVSEKSITSTLSNKTYSLGDTVMIGAPKFGNEYSTVYHYNEIKNQYEILIGESFPQTKGIITGIAILDNHKFYGFSNKTIIQINDENDKSFFFEHEESEKKGEIVVYENPISINHYPNFNLEVNSIFTLKAKGLSGDEALLHYVAATDNAKFKAWKNNEFQFNREKEMVRRRLDSISSNLNYGDTILFIIKGKIGTYDFSKKGFPVIETYGAYSEHINKPLFGNYQFSNFKDFSFVPSTESQAEFFVKTLGRSETHRHVNFVLKITVDDIVYTPGTFDDYAYKMTIIEMSVVNNDALFYNYIGGKLN